MDVDLVITELEVGGAERALTQLALGLHTTDTSRADTSRADTSRADTSRADTSRADSEVGDDRVRVFALRCPPKRTELVERLEQAGIPIRYGNARSWRDVRSVRKQLRDWMTERPGAICQSFLFHANVLTAVCLPAGRRSVAGLRVAEPRPIRCMIERRALRRFDHVICVSKAVARFAEDRLNVPTDRHTVIANAVEADRFTGARPVDWQSIGWSTAARVALFIGRFHPQKNLASLQRTAPAWLGDDPNRKLVLIGDGPLRESIEKWASEMGSDRVRVLPWQADVAPWLAACRVLVLPSRYEGMPNVVLEAMAAGRPVVCSRVEGSEELVRADTLQSFDLDDDPQLIERVDRFLAEDQLADRVGEGNRKRALAEFSVARMVQAYRQTYLKVLRSVPDSSADLRPGTSVANSHSVQ